MGKRSEVEGAQFVQYFGPLLDALRNLGGSATPSEAVERIAEDLQISEQTQNELLESGGPRFQNQVAWARFYLVKDGRLDASKRGVWSLTEKGRETHLTYEEAHQIFRKWVKVFAERRETKKARKTDAEVEVPGSAQSIEEHYGDELLDLLKALTPKGFEQLCQRLLRESGFTQVVVTGSSGDGGIDGYGILQVNPLVSFKVLFQCKRYKESVGPAQVRDFRGAMQGRADKGLILTTGTFTTDARKEAVRDGVPPIELIPGTSLVEMFEKLELGLKPRTVFDIDYAFFEDFGWAGEV